MQPPVKVFCAGVLRGAAVGGVLRGVLRTGVLQGFCRGGVRNFSLPARPPPAARGLRNFSAPGPERQIRPRGASVDVAKFGACDVVKRAGYYELRCPEGLVQVTPKAVRLYTSHGAYMASSSTVVKGRVSAVTPVEEDLPSLLSDVGAEVSYGTPEELYEALREWEEEQARRAEEERAIARLRAQLEALRRRRELFGFKYV